MSNFDRLKTKDASEKQQQLTSAPDVTKQLEIGVKDARLDDKHDAKLIQLKYLSQGGKNFDAKVVERFDFTEQTNVKMRNGKPKMETVKDTNGNQVEQVQREGKPGVKEFLQPFVDIKSVFGQGFLDHALYDYNIPYAQLEQFSKDIASINEALKQGLMRLTEEEERTLLAELQVGNVDHQKFLETQKAETLTSAELLPGTKLESPRDKQILVLLQGRMTKYHDTYLNGLQTVFKNDPRMDADSASNLARAITSYGMDELSAKITAQLKPDKKYSDVELASIISSPTISDGSQKKQGDAFMLALKNVTTCVGTDGNPCEFTSFDQILEFSSPDASKKFIAEAIKDPSKIKLTEKTPAVLVSASLTETQKSFQNMLAMMQKATPATAAETRLHAASPVLSQIGGGLEAFADHVTGFVDNLKATGAREKIEKIRNLLFGTGDFLDRLSKFNEMKESGLGVEKIAALQGGINLLNEGNDGLDDLDNKRDQESKTGPLDDTEKETAHQKLGAILFNTTYLGKERNVSPRCAQLKTTLGEETYTKMVGSGNDLYDLMAKNMLTPEHYTSYLTYRSNGDGKSAQMILEKGGVGKVVEEIGKDHPNITSYQLYVKTLLTRMIGTKENAAGMVKATTNETQKGIDAARVELDQLTKSMEMRVDGDKVYLDGISATDHVGIKVDSADPIDYNHDTGVALNSLGTPPKFTVVKKQADGKWSNLVRTGDLSVVSSANIEVGTDQKQVTVKGLEAGEYSFSTSYKKDATTNVVDTQATVSTKDSPLTHTFATDKGEPTVLKIKPKTGGLRQTVWKSV